ncbi:MAG: hypothetical protein V4691_08270, partial [Pseudomonadota bacterium]
PLVCLWRGVRDEPGRYGLALFISLEITYVLSGLFGIMFGQDLMDTVFISATAIAAYLVFGENNRETGPQTSGQA